MSLGERSREVGRSIFFAASNWITLIGVVLTTSAGITLVMFWLMEMLSPRPVNPYAGMLLFTLLPGVFLLGLILMPLGIFLRRRKLRKTGSLPHESPRIDLGLPSVRKVLFFVGLATCANVVIMGTAGYKGVSYMDSAQFCGLTCHTPMQPEYTAYLNSPHSRVECVQCHVGPGVQGFVRAKLAGTRQLMGVLFNSYQRPIPSPVHSLRPARETCEHCHWPQKFTGDKLVVLTKYADDEANTPSTTVLLLKIGGHSPQGAVGIHGRHLDAGSRVTYIATDEERQVIPKVIYRENSGKLVDFETDDYKNLTPAQLAKAETRTMDCIDCHNRPSHNFELPDRAVNEAMASGRISPTLPYIKKKAIEVLKTNYATRAIARVQIPQTLIAYYQSTYPDVYRQHQDLVDKASTAVLAIYLRNIFPDMKVTWGTHPNNLGHDDFPGCFRCHDGSHTSKDGRMITADCDACHTILAQDEKDPKILKDLGISN